MYDCSGQTELLILLPRLQPYYWRYQGLLRITLAFFYWKIFTMEVTIWNGNHVSFSAIWSAVVSDWVVWSTCEFLLKYIIYSTNQYRQGYKYIVIYFRIIFVNVWSTFSVHQYTHCKKHMCLKKIWLSSQDPRELSPTVYYCIGKWLWHVSSIIRTRPINDCT